MAVEEVEFAQIWKALPKVVFSTTLQSVVGNTRLASGDVGEEVSRLEQQPGRTSPSVAPASPARV